MEQENKPTDKEAILKRCIGETTFNNAPAFKNYALRAMDEYAASLLKDRDELKEKYEHLVKANSFKGQLNSEYYEKLTALQSSNEAKEKEIERLKGLIEKAFKLDTFECNCDDCYEKFKTENNL